MDNVRIAFTQLLDVVDNAKIFFERYDVKVPLSVVAETVFADINSKVEGAITRTDATIAVMKYFNTHGPEPWMDLNAKDIVEMHVWATL